MTEQFRQEAGFSLVEVMVAIVILLVAIIPMVAMFDTGLKSATLSSNYDRARTLANLKLEQAKNLPYETVRTDFPSEAASGKGAPDASGSVTSSPVTTAEDAQVPNGFTYVVTKQYLQQPSATPSSASEDFTPSASATDTRLLRITVTVTWSGNSYQTIGLVSG